MKYRHIFFLIPIAFMLMVLSCASYKQLSPLEQKNLEKDLRILLRNKERLQSNSAYLAQIKLKTPDIKKKFKLEIYCRGDSISFYSPGFLGKGTFKGIIHNDSLSFYLPSEKAYYRGLWHDLTEPDLGRWAGVFRLTLDILNGSFLPEGRESNVTRGYDLSLNRKYNDVNIGVGKWDCHFLYRPPTLKRAVYGWSDDILVFNIWIKGFDEDFPYFNLDRAYIHYDNSLQRNIDKEIESYKSDIRIDFIRQKYNIDIPPEKFELHIPINAERIEGLMLQ